MAKQNKSKKKKRSAPQAPAAKPAQTAPAPEQPAVVLLTSEELSHQPALPGLERTLHHTPPARDARVCKAEVRLTLTLLVDVLSLVGLVQTLRGLKSPLPGIWRITRAFHPFN